LVPFRKHTQCATAVANVLFEVFQFLAGLVQIGIQRADEFRKALVGYVMKHVSMADFDWLNKMVRMLADSEDMSERIGVVTARLRKAMREGGSWIKVQLQWLAKDMNPWEMTRKLLPLVAKLAVWFQNDFQAYASQVGLQLISATKVIATTARAVHACDATPSSDITLPVESWRSFSNFLSMDFPM
jgi:hypothetical protein